MTESTTIVCSIDPGKMSGVAAWRSDAPACMVADELDPLETVLFVIDLYRVHRSDLEVVSEKFTISERTIKTALSLDALDINGWLTMQCQLWGISYEQQTPTQAKKFATDDKLKAIDWFERTKDGHANDAARHLVVYLYRRHRTLFNEHILPPMAKEILKP